ncbi:MAG: hypothetical protein EXR76_05840 [Myxococcales bacterium]|nr:hypothetical protein [Myxococcales bacterium]
MQHWSLRLGISLGLSLGLTACSKPDPSSAEHWMEKLESGERLNAIQKLGALKATGAVERLKQEYKKGTDRHAIVAALAKIGDKSVVPLLLEALQGMDESLAQIAGETLKLWEVKEQVDTYIAVAANPGAPKRARLVALELLVRFPDPKAAPTLVSILESDPDKDPILFMGLAAEALGKLGSEQAVSGLIRCQWLDDHGRANEVPRCRMALNRIGPKAVPGIIEALERKNRGVEERARKFMFDKGGLIEAKCGELLGDMPDPSAVEPLIASLKQFDELPPNMTDPRKVQMFVMSGVQKVISLANALAVTGDERAVKPLLELAGDKELALEHKLAGVQQLAFLGQQSAVPGMQKLLAVDADPEDPVSNGFRVQIALNLANLIDGSQPKVVDGAEKQITAVQAKVQKWVADWEKKAESLQGQDKQAAAANVAGYKEWHKNYGEALGKLKALRECKGDTACWGTKLTDADDGIRMKAAYQLANEKTDKAGALKALETQMGTNDLTLRNVVFFGLGRLGDKSLLPALEKVRAADEAIAQKDARFSGAKYTTELMIAKLGHK